MSQYLPEKNFAWEEDYFSDRDMDIVKSKILDLKDDSPDGYFFEVDLKYPKELHDLHNEFPLCPEQLEVKDEWMSEYQRNMKKSLQIKGKSKKLCLTLFDKKQYVLHYKNLKFCLENGLILTKVHKVLKFKQSQWLQPYIMLNTLLRQSATSKFEENFAKLMNNSVYGKTCENVRKYKNVKLATNQNEIEKILRSPLVSDWKIYHENLASFELISKSVTLNKPRYVGLTVLELSKLLMYNFHYNYILKKFENVKILLSDTDSFCYNIKTKKDFYKTIKEDLDWFDFSNYNKDHENYNADNHLVPGKMKDEMGGKIIEEFVGLRSKMYSITVKNQHDKRAAKGFLRNIQKNKIRHEDYLKCIDDVTDMTFTGNKIHHENHEIFLMEITKRGLCAYNDKKHIEKKGFRDFDCTSFGHYKLFED